MFLTRDAEEVVLPSRVEFEEGTLAHSTVRLRPADVLSVSCRRLRAWLAISMRC
jgi:hypothetical protein